MVGGVIVIVLGYFAYIQFMWNPDNDKSKDSYWAGLNYATADSTDMAIDELEAQVKKFDGKVGGEVAQFVLARQYMAKGEFKDALKELENVDLSDVYVSVMAKGLRADCHSELKDYEKAANLYLEAAEASDNDFTAPMYLMKAGLCAEELKDFTKGFVKVQMAQYGQLNPEEKELDDIVQRVLSNQDEAKRLQEQLVSQKLLTFYKENITFKEKEVNYEEFVKEVYK